MNRAYTRSFPPNTNISRISVCRRLSHMQITRKRLPLIPEERNSIDKIDARAVYASEVVRFPRKNILFLDETGFNLHTRRNYGYSPVNTKAYITSPTNKLLVKV
ncbi:hypothetical protein H311_02705 [Anncaliia algerae PRA109]|nr:hypothetical protein H311_02705 [Anncaliia algerae PRA109]